MMLKFSCVLLDFVGEDAKSQAVARELEPLPALGQAVDLQVTSIVQARTCV